MTSLSKPQTALSPPREREHFGDGRTGGKRKGGKKKPHKLKWLTAHRLLLKRLNTELY